MYKFKIQGINWVVPAFFLIFSQMASAQATRTWVSGVGDDANPCSRTAPCKTFAGAISKTAAGGEIDALDPGGFGAVTITKSIILDGGGMGMAGILSAGTTGIIVNAGPTDIVVIRNVNINGALVAGASGIGIRYLGGKELHVENVIIENLVGKGIDVTTTTANTVLAVRDTIIRNAADPTNGGGIHIHPASPGTVTASLDNVRMDNNKFGIRIEDNTKATVRNSVASNSTPGFGFSISGIAAAAEMFIESSVTNNNAGGGIGLGGSFAKAYISNVSIYNNAVGLSPTTGQIISFGNNRNNGNIGNNNGAPTSTILPQ